MAIRTTSANAIVAIAKTTPRNRNAGTPRTSAAAAPIAAPTGIPTNTGENVPNNGSSGTTHVDKNAPSEANPACPRLSCPAMSTTRKE